MYLQYGIVKSINIYYVFVLLGLLDCALWSVTLFQPQNNEIYPQIFLITRIIFCTIIFLFVRSKTKDKDLNILNIFTPIFFFLFGVIGLLAMYFIFNIIKDHSTQKAQLYHIDKEEGDERLHSYISDKHVLINFDELREVAPLADGMTDDDTLMRIAAINAIEETDSTKMFNILIDSKSDKAKEVQYYAHEALKKIGDKYMRRINVLTGIINKQGQDYFTFKELADLYAILAHKNLEHPILVRFYRLEAIKYYSEILEKYSHYRKTILSSLIPVLYENGEYDKCVKYCEELYMDTDYYSLSVEFIARCLFQARDIKSLKRFIQKEKRSNITSINNYIELQQNNISNG